MFDVPRPPISQGSSHIHPATLSPAAPDDGKVKRSEAALKLVLSALTACLRSCCRRPRVPTPTGTPGRRTAGGARCAGQGAGGPLTSSRRVPVRRLIVHQARRLGPGDGRGGPLFGVPLPEPGDAPRQGLRLRPTSRRAVY